MKIKYPLVLLILSLTLFSCKSPKAENLEEMARLAARPEAVLVKTVKLEKSTFYHELISNGKVSSSEKAVVPFKINGIIKELRIQNGQKVKAGDLMAVIDDLDYKTQLTRAKQGLGKADGAWIIFMRSAMHRLPEMPDIVFLHCYWLAAF